jgi:hypothetical protein
VELLLSDLKNGERRCVYINDVIIVIIGISKRVTYHWNFKMRSLFVAACCHWSTCIVDISGRLGAERFRKMTLTSPNLLKMNETLNIILEFRLYQIYVLLIIQYTFMLLFDFVRFTITWFLWEKIKKYWRSYDYVTNEKECI